MSYKRLVFTIVVVVFLLTGCMSASFSGDYVLRSGETLRGNLFVTSGSVTLQENSRVTGSIFLTSGELHIRKNAEVGKDVVLTSGDLYLEDGAVVHGDVVLASQSIEVNKAPGAQIEGNVTSNIVPYAVSLISRTILLYCVLPLFVLILVIVLLGVWLGRASQKKPAGAQEPAPVAADDTQAKLQQLKSMLDQGLITEADYESKKAEILSKV